MDMILICFQNNTYNEPNNVYEHNFRFVWLSYTHIMWATRIREMFCCEIKGKKFQMFFESHYQRTQQTLNTKIWPKNDEKKPK